jgi:DNA polymerase-4
LQATRKIVHVDMDAFFASVEQRDFPHLKGLPVVVGGSHERRGVVAAASYEARKFGIHSAMSMAEAGRRCPHLQRQPVRMQVYLEVSRQIREIFARYTDRIEPLSIDEAFLDLTATCEQQQTTATRLAHRLKSEIFTETGLTASAGVAPNKFLAKVASDMRKPDGLTVVLPDAVQQFLDPLPVRKIWGVGPATAERLARLEIHTIAQLRALSLERALELFGKSGLLYYHLARGQDQRPVACREQARSISTERTFPQDIRDADALHQELDRMACDVAKGCKDSKVSGYTVVLKLRYEDFSTITRSQTLAAPTRCAERILDVGKSLLEKTDFRIRPVRLLGIGLGGLLGDDRPRQLSLFPELAEADSDDRRSTGQRGPRS